MIEKRRFFVKMETKGRVAKLEAQTFMPRHFDFLLVFFHLLTHACIFLIKPSKLETKLLHWVSHWSAFCLFYSKVGFAGKEERIGPT